jgi:hypothetical protein
LKLLTLIVGLLLSNIVNGQQLKFRGFPVDTISIRSSSGGYQHGGLKGRSDYFNITFDKKTNKYNAEYKKNYSKTSSKPNATWEKVKQLNKNKTVSNSSIEGLLNAFSTKNLKPTFENFGYNEKQFLSLTDGKHIRKVAKRYKRNWQFRRAYSSREENEIIFKGCQNLDTFSLFISSKFDTTHYILVTDYWDEMKVKITTNEKEFRFEGHYPNTFKQPWYDHSDTSKFFIPIVNLNINRFLVEILPNKFYKRKTIELQSLTDNYIKWYLKRRGIIYRYDNYETEE